MMLLVIMATTGTAPFVNNVNNEYTKDAVFPEKAADFSSCLSFSLDNRQ